MIINVGNFARLITSILESLCRQRGLSRKMRLLMYELSRFIVFGILVSYLPQHWRIVARHSSEGLSPYYVLLGTTSGTCAFANVLTQAASQRAMSCCKEVTGLECTASLLGIAQIGVQWACFTIMYANSIEYVFVC